MEKKTKKVVASMLALAVLVVFSLIGYAGSLEPAAAPGPTMKTLDEVEPRVPIHASDLPLVVTEPNSYYLVEDINFTDDANHAITVECNDVTIDLMGYTLTGPNNGTGYGVYMDSRSNVEIRNGTIRKFNRGIYEANNSGKDHRVIGIRALGNTTQGIFLNGDGHLVTNCTASDNGDSAVTDVYGIYANTYCTVTDNIARDNGNSGTADVHGIYAGQGCTVTGNTSCSNGLLATGTDVSGIRVGSGSTVTSNTANSNGFSAYIYNGIVYGIHVGDGSTVTSNTANSNGSSADADVYGIHVGGGSTVTGNTARYNGNPPSTRYAYGIYVLSYCLVDQNTASYNGNNIYTEGGCEVGLNVAAP